MARLYWKNRRDGHNKAEELAIIHTRLPGNKPPVGLNKKYCQGVKKDGKKCEALCGMVGYCVQHKDQALG